MLAREPQSANFATTINDSRLVLDKSKASMISIANAAASSEFSTSGSSSFATRRISVGRGLPISSSSYTARKSGVQPVLHVLLVQWFVLSMSYNMHR